MDKGGEQVESGVYYTRRVIQADSNVFWTHKLTSNISDYNKQNPLKFYQY